MRVAAVGVDDQHVGASDARATERSGREEVRDLRAVGRERRRRSFLGDPERLASLGVDDVEALPLGGCEGNP
jgi:hypothetical protein